MKQNNLILLTLLLTQVNICERPQPGVSVWNIVASTQSIELTTASKLDEIMFDFSGVFTALDAALDGACTIHSELDITESIGEAVDLDFSGVFTALNDLDSKIDIVQSKTENLRSGIFFISGQEGTFIRQANLGTTGLTLTEPGTYLFAQDIAYPPSGTGSTAITISGDNITLDFNGRTLSQAIAMGNTIGVEIASSLNNIQITGGTITGFTAQSINVNDSDAININNMNCIDNGSQPGIQLGSGVTDVILDAVHIENSSDDGVRAFNATNLQINDCSITACSNEGIQLQESNNVSIKNCSITNNNNGGISVQGPNASATLINNCSLARNGGAGPAIEILDTEDVLITNCFLSENTDSAIQIINSERIKVIDNYMTNNDDNNILLDGTTQNCYIFDNCMLLSSSVNLREASTAGPNSVLGNYALGVAFADNFVTLSGNTNFNEEEFDQAGPFPSPAPVAWDNFSVRV